VSLNLSDALKETDRMALGRFPGPIRFSVRNPFWMSDLAFECLI
jgi:hypothetical protein